MRLLYVAPGYKPAFRLGGPVVSIGAAAEHLVRRGHHVTVVATNSNLDEDLDVPVGQAVDVDGVEVLYFRHEEPLQRWLPFVPYLSQSVGFLYAPGMRDALRRLAPGADLVHTQLPFVYPTFAGARAAREARKPLFYQQRGLFGPQHLLFRSLKKKLYIGLVERPILRRATTLVALTEAEVASYRALGVATPCRVVPNGVEAEQYRTMPRLPPASLPGVASDALVVLFMGRLHPTKGVGSLLEAFRRVAPSFPGAVLAVAGPDECGLVRGAVADARAAGLAGRVFFPGMVSGDAKLDLLARADLFCLPSAGEGFSLAVLEAMASGTAVLLSPGCHFPEVEAAGAGRVVSASPEALAGALRELLSHPARLRAMGERARAHVARHYGWDAVVTRLEETYREGLERHARDEGRTTSRTSAS